MNLKYAKRSEDTEQILVIQWAMIQTGAHPELKWLHHCPNGGSRNKSEAVKLKQMGVKAGVSDPFLPQPKGRYSGLYIEMKYGNNKLTTAQKDFIADMKKAGFYMAVCYAAEAAIEVIKEYIALKDGAAMKAENGSIYKTGA